MRTSTPVLRRILLPLDGSARAERAIPWVIALGRAFGSEVVLLRVVEGRTASDGAWTDPVSWRMERSEAVAYLERVKTRIEEAGIRVDIDVGVGRPSEEIVEAARDRKADLVALTTHGRGGATMVPLAGTAHKVVSGASTSILLVPASTENHPGGPRRVLVGLDGSPRAEWALCAATTIARAVGVPLHLVYVVPPAEVLTVIDDESLQRMAGELAAASRRLGERYLANVSGRLTSPECEMSTRALEATTTVPRALADVAAEEPDTLVVLSARGRSAANGYVYGNVARAMVETARQPLLVLRDAPPAALSSWPSSRRASARRPVDRAPTV